MTHGESRRRSEAPGYAIRLDWHEGNQLYLADWDRKPDRHVTPFPAAARWFATLAEATSTARLLDMISGEKWIATTIPADARPCRCKAEASGYLQRIGPEPAGTCDRCGDKQPMPEITMCTRYVTRDGRRRKCLGNFVPPPADVQHAYPSTELCPNCGNEHTAKVADSLRCFRCGNAWPSERHSIVESIDELAKFYQTADWPTYEVGPEDDGLTDEQVSMAARAAAQTVFPELDDDALDAIEAEIKAEMRNVGGVFVP
jgi:hypothetical protein